MAFRRAVFLDTATVDTGDLDRSALLARAKRWDFHDFTAAAGGFIDFQLLAGAGRCRKCEDQLEFCGAPEPSGHRSHLPARVL